jgi:hypothetical protein
MIEKLPLTVAIGRDRFGRHPMKPVPHPIELTKAAAQLLRNFRSRLGCGLRTPSPTAGKLAEIFAVGAIAANGQPFALRQSGEQRKVGGAKREAQFTFALQAACEREPLILGALTGDCSFAQVRK